MFLDVCIYDYDLPSENCFATPHKFGGIVFPFSFVLRYFLISLLICLLTHLWLRSMLFHLHIFVNSRVFCLSSFLVSYHCGQQRCVMFLIFLNLLRLASWPNIRSVLENIPCARPKNVCSAAFGGDVLCIS